LSTLSSLRPTVVAPTMRDMERFVKALEMPFDN